MDNRIREGYIGNPDQLYGVRRIEIQDGKGKGNTVLEVYTAGGLQVDILPDTGLDIGQVRYRGVNMSFTSKNGMDSADAILPFENDFPHTFPGGLVYTCGLRSTGPPSRDADGEWHPLHGRYHKSGAFDLCAAVEGEDIVISGTVRETALFGDVFEVRRTITIPVNGSAIRLRDTITNNTPHAQEYMLLYHCNFGYPLLSEAATLTLDEKRKTTPRSEFAKTALGKECTFTRPVDGEEERVFFHEDMRPHARLENPALGIAMDMSWSGDTLPIFSQWRSMASGDYVLGLEPGNSYMMGRPAERENGSIRVLPPFGSVETEVAISFQETQL